jgi:NAD(P)-dependent dehydrogenase (short-subunit alcohol dehydrogenase family)
MSGSNVKQHEAKPSSGVQKVVLVTAASKGIGAGIAREFAARGYGVALLARADAVHAVAKELGGIAVTGSVTRAESLEHLVSSALHQWGRIDTVINNTGHPAKGDLLALREDAWSEGYELILESAMRMARLVTPIMERQGSGSFVTISSYAAVRPDLARPVSSVFRAALGAWTKLHAEHCAPKGIRVNAVMPGFVDSYAATPEVIASIPMQRIGKVAELAKVVAWLASDEASYITGQNLLVDGGMVRSL